MSKFTNSPTVIVMPPKAPAPPNAAQIFGKVITELEGGQTVVSKDGPQFAILSIILGFFHSLQKMQTLESIEQVVLDLTVSIEVAINGVLTELQKTQEEARNLSDRAFGAETSLEIRIRENIELQQLLKAARESARQQDQSLVSMVETTLATAQRETHAIQELEDMLGRIKTPLAQSIIELRSVIRPLEKNPVSTSPAIKFADPTEEISRREVWLEGARAIIQRLGDERDELQAEIDQQDDLIKYASGGNRERST